MTEVGGTLPSGTRLGAARPASLSLAATTMYR